MTPSAGLEIEVDREVCMGSGNCVFWAPGTFELDGDDVATVVDPDAAGVDEVLQAARNCPTRAIAVRRDGEPLT